MTTDDRPPDLSPPLVITGTASSDVSAALAAALGYPLTARTIERFPDGELHVEVCDPVRGGNVFVVQSTGAPVGESLLELLLIADACRRGGARQVVAVLPYVGYGRQDRRAREGEALGIAVFAGALAQGRFERVVAVDLHAPATEGAFTVPVDQVSAIPLLADILSQDPPARPVIVAPDLGAVRMARAYAHRLGAPVATVHKQRRGGAEVTVDEVIGDVEGRTPIIVDDILATGGTVAAAIAAVRERGATGAALVVTSHLVPRTGAPARLTGLPIARVITTDSLPGGGDAWPCPVERVSLAPLLADAIGRVHHGAALDDLMVAR